MTDKILYVPSTETQGKKQKKGHNYALSTEVTCPQKCHIFLELMIP